MDYILYFVFAGIIVIALVIYWIIEFLIAKKIKLKAIDELDKQISEEEAKKAEQNEKPIIETTKVLEPTEQIIVKETTPKKKTSSKKSSSKK